MEACVRPSTPQDTRTRYAKSGDVHIAYQVIGTGPIDLVVIPGFISNLDVHWEQPGYAHLLWRLGSFSRLIMFDKRGTGLSDPVSVLPNLETRMDDVRAVMDAAGSARAALLGGSEGGPLAMLFAATYPERTRALALYGAYAPFHKWVLSPEKLASFIVQAEQTWGSGASLASFAPSMVDNPRFCEWWARYERLGASPAAVIALFRMNAKIDVRSVLPAIRVPTLIMHRRDDVRVQFAAARYLADHIPRAKLVELPGRDHLMWVGDTERIVDEVEEFLTGIRPHHHPDRVLVTLVALDAAGPQRLDARRQLRAVTETLLPRFRGRILRDDAEGLIVCFDGPVRAVQFARDTILASSGKAARIRCGIHIGEIAMPDEDGPAKDIVLCIAAHARAGEIWASAIVRDLVAGSDIGFGENHESIAGTGDEPLRLHRIKTDDTADEDAPAHDGTDLSARERQILRLVAEGMTNAQIAAKLDLSDHTVKRHVANILAKLDLPTRTAAAHFAVQHGLA
jgi:pimeloyl-ACP methyl ester carboxylesterase/DNA-binding NarL/FixJ family response regulator